MLLLIAARDNTKTLPVSRTRRGALCAALSGCAYFSYEYEYQTNLGLAIHECYMKGPYTMSDVPAGLTMAICTHYTIWEPGPVWDQHYMDQNWLGAAGPRACPRPPPHQSRRG